MLRIENLYFYYEEKEILRGVNLKLKHEVGCILGANGVGKSTLLKSIVGLLKPKKGIIEFNGKNILNLGFKDRAKLISYVPQEFSINFPYTVFDTVLMGRNPHVDFLEGPNSKDEKITLKCLNILGINYLKDRPFTQLSGGQKRLVLIARGLAQEGKLMIFDEPTSYLDFKNQILVLSVIEKISRKFGKLVLLSLHDPNLAFFFCDNVFLMKDGVIIDCGKPDDVITEENIERLYNGLKTELIKFSDKKLVVPNKEFLELDVVL
ncbi:ABC transporter ATP-binding protein [Methanotorris formicicus]|uniref:ABC transporter related protein n=1 Tax=Methanotorris formicicus Mc-S-70 TaxID=647171 RepID=H1KWV2_9EURY|nr:ABC transporter ATP-binding protein [Methanotorris formicicus]EHP89085.1 ABC transporter related protein [Methanotorris formicicus Mc-S-70]